jgi:hypothetical protein
VRDRGKQCQIAKPKVQMKSEAQIRGFIEKETLTLGAFGIDLKFACLREDASAKAGILTFEIIL